jgi:hypothetical protein
MNTSQAGKLETQRQILGRSLSEVANEIGMTMRDAGLHFPVYITLRDSGDSLATIATPLDPSDDDWQNAVDIVCRIVGNKVRCDRLIGRELTCAVANGPMIAAEVTSG